MLWNQLRLIAWANWRTRVFVCQVIAPTSKRFINWINIIQIYCVHVNTRTIKAVTTTRLYAYRVPGPLDPAFHEALFEPILWSFLIDPLNLLSQSLIVSLVKERERLEFIKFNFIKLVIFWIPQVVKNSINLYYISHLNVLVAVLMRHVCELKNIDAKLIELSYYLVVVSLGVFVATHFLSLLIHF